MPPVEQNSVAKTYSTAFVLDSSKLSRIETIIREEFRDDAAFAMRVGVDLERGQSIEVRDIEELLKVDNTVRNGVASVRIEAAGGEKSASLSFGKVKGKGQISLRVVGRDVRQANDLFAELEEQAERTMLRGWLQRYLGPTMAITFLMLAVVLGVLTLVDPGQSVTKFEGQDFLSRDDVAALNGLSDSLVTMEDKLDFLVATRRRQLVNIDTKAATRISLRELRGETLLKALPFILMFGVLLYLGSACYPEVVFRWGDQGERYEGILTRRKILWTVVIGGFVISILAGVSIELWRPGGAPD